MLPETMSLISKRLGNLGIVFWKCFDVSEVTFLGISVLWAFSKEIVSCLIWPKTRQNLISCKLEAWLARQLFCSCPNSSCIVMNHIPLP